MKKIFAMCMCLIACSGSNGEPGPQGIQGLQGIQGSQGAAGTNTTVNCSAPQYFSANGEGNDPSVQEQCGDVNYEVDCKSITAVDCFANGFGGSDSTTVSTSLKCNIDNADELFMTCGFPN